MEYQQILEEIKRNLRHEDFSSYLDEEIEKMIEKLYQQPFIEIEQIHYQLLNIKEHEKSFQIRY